MPPAPLGWYHVANISYIFSSIDYSLKDMFMSQLSTEDKCKVDICLVLKTISKAVDMIGFSCTIVHNRFYASLS